MSNKKFTTELLPKSGIQVSIADDGFVLYNPQSPGVRIFLSTSCINRLHGIAFPEKVHGCCKVKELDENEEGRELPDNE